MKNIFLLSVLLFATAAFGQGAQRGPSQATVNAGGFVKVLSHAQITVLNATGLTLASIYSDSGLTSPITQPLYADSNGMYTYYAAAGNYVEQVASPGVVTQVFYLTLSGSGGTSGLGDPGANGVVFRSAPGVTRPAVGSDVPTIAESQVTNLVSDLAARLTAATYNPDWNASSGPTAILNKPTGFVSNTGSLTSGSCVLGNGGSSVRGDTACSSDGFGNITTTTVAAKAFAMPQGALPAFSLFPANSIIQTAPTSAVKYFYIHAMTPATGIGHYTYSATPNPQITESFAPVNLGNADVTGNLQVANLNSGTNASSTTVWRGDGLWQPVSAPMVDATICSGMLCAVSANVTPAVAGATSAGSTLLPFSGVYVGNVATNNTKITANTTAARIALLPDATGTLLMTGNGNVPLQTATAAGCATSASAGATCTTTLTWATAFADTSYKAVCNGELVTSGVPLDGGLTAKIAGSVTFQTVAATSVAAQFTNISCIAIHN